MLTRYTCAVHSIKENYLNFKSLFFKTHSFHCTSSRIFHFKKHSYLMHLRKANTHRKGLNTEMRPIHVKLVFQKIFLWICELWHKRFNDWFASSMHSNWFKKKKTSRNMDRKWFSKRKIATVLLLMFDPRANISASCSW